MRDLLLFALCCALAAGYWASSHQQAQEREVAMQEQLYQLGAPQTMEDSPERSLLLGDFARGLRADPRGETYDRLAPLFLASVDLEDRKVAALAFHAEMMGRVLGKSVQLFTPRGEALKPRMWDLGQKAEPSDRPFEVDQAPTLVADGPWLIYKDKRRSAAFRMFGDEARGYVSVEDLGVDGDALLVDGKRAWNWSQGRLDPVSGGSPSPSP